MINLGGIEIQANQKITIAMPTGTISTMGMENAREKLSELLGKEVKWPIGWSYEATVTGRGEFVGTLSKRISKFLYVTERYKISPDDLARVCGAAFEGSTDATTFVIDFDEQLTWRSGDFGDHGSCWWDAGQQYLRCFRAIGGKAVRFWNPNDTSKGIGRAWVLPDQPAPGLFLLFNGYMTGRNTSDPTVIAARVITQHFGFTYKRVTPSFRRADNNNTFFYLNGAKGFVMGPAEIMSTVTFNERMDMTFSADVINAATESARAANRVGARHLDPLVLA